MKNSKTTAALLSSCLIGLGSAGQSVLADDDHHDRHRVDARLSGYEEVQFVTTTIQVPSTTPPATVGVLNSAAVRGAISTRARGTFRATIEKDEIRYRLSYQGLEGTVTQAHIHFGQRRTVGGIVVWLCQTAGTPAPASVAALTPTCPPEGTVSGTITPAQVLAVGGQGIAAGEFDELVRAIRAGATYANVHSALHPPGEIRGQIGRRDDD
jgi:hypothetical protein